MYYSWYVLPTYVLFSNSYYSGYKDVDSKILYANEFVV